MVSRARAQEHGRDLGIKVLPCIHVYAGEVIVEDLVCGPKEFGEVRNKIANDLACDPRSEAPCELVYDDELGPIPDFSVVPSGYSTDFYALTHPTPESLAELGGVEGTARGSAADPLAPQDGPPRRLRAPVDEAPRPKLRRGTRLVRYLKYALSLDG